MEFLSKESINSKELLKQINIFREMEYKEKEANNTLTEAQKKRGRYIELRHDNLLRTIRDELNIKTVGKIAKALDVEVTELLILD